MVRPGVALMLMLLLTSACIVEAPTGEPPPRERARATTSVARTTTVRVGANLGDQIELVSFSITPGELIPGEVAQAQLLLRALKEPDRDWQVFVHVEDAAGKGGRLNLDHPPAGGRHPATQWKKGDNVRDEFTVPVPAELGSDALSFYVGLWDPKTDARLQVKNRDAVHHDGKDRVLAAKVPVAGK